MRNLMNDLVKVYQSHGYQIDIKRNLTEKNLVRLDVWNGHKFFGSQWFHEDGSVVICYNQP